MDSVFPLHTLCPNLLLSITILPSFQSIPQHNIMLNRQITLTILLFLLSYQLIAQSIAFESLTCNAQINPIAIDSEQPLLL